jgi:glutaredoxin
MPRSWYLDRPLWVVGGLIAVGAGWYLLRDSDGEVGGSSGLTRPSEAASCRFDRLVLYTRAGCHLCDEARAMLNKYAGSLPPIMEVDIDTDPELVSRFSTCVPVVELDGKVRFRGRVNEILLRRLIAATPPRDTVR